jgi:hypothetical protein
MEQHLEQEIQSFIHELVKENQTEEVVLDILKLINERILTKEIIQKTRIGEILTTVRSHFHTNDEIGEKCGLLLKRWKDIVRPLKNRAGSQQQVIEQEREEEEGSRPSVLRNQTYTITFGDQAENHVGMQKIGSLSSEGFSLTDLQRAKEWFESQGKSCELIALHESLSAKKQNPSLEAYVLIARGGVSAVLDSDNASPSADAASDLMMEQFNLPKDRHAFMYGRVVQKHARYNLCFSSFEQEPDYANGKGRVVSYESVPLLKRIREKWSDIIGEKAHQLEAEGNYYYDLTKCGIGYHGDTERRKVIAIRMGESIPLYYVWYENSKPISGRIRIELGHGDVYFMSEKATGQDWKKKKFPTLRHATGVEKFVRLAS